MNKRMVLYTLGQIVKLEAACLVLPLVTALLYREVCALHIAIVAVVALVLGFAMTLISRPRNQVVYAKEGFIIVAGAWVLMSAIGALPFFFSGEIPNYIDAFFETVSGFTTTGASILEDVETISRGLLFWRSFTHWIGGMGVLVLMMAVMPAATSGRTIHIMRAEMPGPVVGKLTPRVTDTAKVLYLIYLGMTAAEVIFLLCGGMGLFDSLLHAFGTAGTGGFGVYRDSLGSFSPYIQWVVAIFMLLFGVNFNLYYLLLVRRFKEALSSRELWAYGGIVLVAVAVITGNVFRLYENFGEAIRQAAFQVSSIMTTTGYATADFNQWPVLSKTVLFLLMFIGGCAGSTAGGLKVSRVMLLFKSIKRELQRMLHPRSVAVVKMDGRRVDDTTVQGVGTYFALYSILLAIVFLVISIDSGSGFGIETNLASAVSCFNNIGPGLGGTGPAASYAGYSDLSTLVLSVAMLLGRLELYPLLLAFAPSTWTKN